MISGPSDFQELLPTAAPGGAEPLGYVLKCFPRVSETFILNEILELERQGLSLRIYSLNRPEEPVTHRRAHQVRSPIAYLPFPLLPAGLTYLRAHAALFRRFPLKYLRTLLAVLGSFDRDLRERFVQAGYLAGLLERDGVRHLHAGFVHFPGSVAWIVHRITGISFSLATHARDMYRSPPGLLRTKLNEARLVLTCNRYNIENLRRMAAPGGIRRLRQVYHGTDLEHFEFGPHALADPPLVLSVARLVEKKGLHFLIHACRLLADRGVRFQCRIIGAGEWGEKLSELIRRLDLAELVVLEGALEQEQVRAWYRQATVLALPCIITDDGDRDGIPNVLVEAAASGLPIVSTPITGIPELVRHGETGLLVPPRDVKALAHAVEQLIGAPGLREQLRIAARARVEEILDLRRNAATVAEELLAAAGRLPPPPAPAAEDDGAGGRARTLSTIGVRLHGVRLNVHCDDRDWLEHTAALLDGHVVPPWEAPDLEVSGHWRSVPFSEEPGPFFETAGLDAFGKRMHIGPDQLVWSDTYRDPDLQLRFARRGSTPGFDVAYHYRPSIKKLAKYPDYRRKKYFDLLRYLALFPAAWHLERTRGWTILHASVVARHDRAILIAGPGGSGKTTTCVALVERAGMTLVTENLAFCDGSRLFPVREPIRLTEESLALLGDSARELSRFEANPALKRKSMYLAPAPPEGQEIRPAVIFFPQFSGAGFVRRIGPALACELLLATNRLTLELSDYDWYSAALDVLWPQAGNSQARLDAVRRLVEGTPCFALGIDRAAGVSAVVERVLQCFNDIPEAPEIETDARELLHHRP